MRVLVACECSGRVREAFRSRGHDAWSCDIKRSEDGSPHHIASDMFEVIQDGWDLMIAFPPCTHLAVSGARHFKKKRADGRQQAGIDFFLRVARARVPRIAIENPVGIMSKVWRQPDQIIQPWMFGDEAQKSTCLWLKGLPHLVPTKIVDKGEFYTAPSGKRLPAWYANAGSDGQDRATVRSRTFMGIAEAMAEQWGGYSDLVSLMEAA